MARIAGRWTPAVIAWPVARRRGRCRSARSPTAATANDASASTTTDATATSRSSIPRARRPRWSCPDTAATSTVAQNSVPKVPLGRTLSNGLLGDDVGRWCSSASADLKFNPGPGRTACTAATRCRRSGARDRWGDGHGIQGRDRQGELPEMWRPHAGRRRQSRRGAPDSTSTRGDLPAAAGARGVPGRRCRARSPTSRSGELDGDGSDFMKRAEWCEEVTISPGERGNERRHRGDQGRLRSNAWTPGGPTPSTARHDGVRQSALGGMYKPVYFNYGIAVHGAERAERAGLARLHPDQPLHRRHLLST